VSAGIVSAIRPVHEHFSTDTPDTPNSISVSMMADKNMFVARFITGAKVLKNVEMLENFYH
jgi:hypothetical protein